MVSSVNIAWVAGILEGEGCFSSSHHSSPMIQLSMTDLDVVRKVRNIINPEASVTDHHTSVTNKKAYTFRAFGSRAIQWMMTIYPLMSIRRKAKIKEVIEVWVGNGKKVYLSDYCRKGHYLKGSSKSSDGSCRVCKRAYAVKYYRSKKLGTNRAS